jgi:hypothetical protein
MMISGDENIICVCACVRIRSSCSLCLYCYFLRQQDTGLFIIIYLLISLCII